MFGAEFAFFDAQEGGVEAMEQTAVAALPVFAAADDELGLAYSERTRGMSYWAGCRASEMIEAFEQARAHAEASGQWNLADDCIILIALALSEGSKPAEEARALCHELLESAGERVLVQAGVSVSLASLHAISGEAEEARQLLSLANATVREAAYPMLAIGSAFITARIAQAVNDVVAEEGALRQGLVELDRLGDRSYYATVESSLAEFLVRQDRNEEAHAVLRSARAHSSPGDVVNDVALDGVEALLLARRGVHDRADHLARAAVALAETTDFWWARGVAGERLAAVLDLAAATDEARKEFLRTIGIYDQKGATVSAARVRNQLAALAGPVAS
jgi:ATP/maltotriose-dependent transcriptional regulator MalT